jgi:hypothetical protein
MVPSLPFAVGIYLPLQTSFPIFCGGVIRWLIDWINPAKPEESESSPGVLLSSGYIAGGSLIGVLAAFLNFKEDWLQKLNLRENFQRLAMSNEQLEILKNPTAAVPEQLAAAQHRTHFIDTSVTMTAFAIMVILLVAVGSASRFKRKAKAAVAAPAVKK